MKLQAFPLQALQAVAKSNHWCHPLPHCRPNGESTLSTSLLPGCLCMWSIPTLHCSHQRSSMNDKRTALLLSGAAVLVLLPLWWASPTLFTLTFLLPASAAAAVLCVWRWSQRRATERGVAQVTSYVEGFDRLLCLVAESVRYLQEMEALSNGYTRSALLLRLAHVYGDVWQ